jgi:hypothetical protein
MSWPTAAVVISLIVSSALIVVVALRELGARRGRREDELENRRELLREMSAALEEKVDELEKKQERGDG